MMREKIDGALPYLWCISLAIIAVFASPSWIALLPAFVSGMWAGAILAMIDKETD